MKRKVFFIIGRAGQSVFGDYAFSTDNIVNELKKRDDIELVVVGDYKSEEFNMEQLESELEKLIPGQPVTFFIQSHGAFVYKTGFEFLLGENVRLKSKDLFNRIAEKVGDTPVDVFTPACHGGGIMYDREKLPKGSTLVSLTDALNDNNGHDLNTMEENFANFNNNEVTAYNLFQFFLAGFLKNRYYPQIGISGLGVFDLNQQYLEQLGQPFELDMEHCYQVGCPENYEEVHNKIMTARHQYEVIAKEYGLALSMILNKLKKSGMLDVEKKDVKHL